MLCHKSWQKWSKHLFETSSATSNPWAKRNGSCLSANGRPELKLSGYANRAEREHKLVNWGSIRRPLTEPLNDGDTADEGIF
jgi:hypothetical protein